MDNTQQKDSTLPTGKTNSHAWAVNLWKLGTLLGLISLALVLSRETGLQTQFGAIPTANNAAPNFLIVKVGGFRAEIQWTNQQQ